MRAMTDVAAHDSFVDKWRGRWPEWAVAEAFVPTGQRAVAAAWFALLQEWSEAAWGGGDPAPGLAKLAWWQEELRGWAKGARRHPLGVALQPQAAPWNELADAMSALRHRELPAQPQRALAELQALGQACAAVEAALFGAPSAPAPAVASLLAGPAARQGGADAAAALLASWPHARAAARPVRLHGALVRLRLAQAAADGRWRPLPRWRTLWAAWRAARN